VSDQASLLHLVLALALGGLIGLERERQEKPLGGIRTFPLLALLGVLAGSLGDALVVAGGVLAVGGLALASLVANLEDERPGGTGITTEVGAVGTYLLGACLASGRVTLAVVAGGSMAVVLHWKEPFHRAVEALGASDMRAVMRLALIGLVLLPLMPDRDLGPGGAVNPFEAWLVVVLIVGFSLAAYVLHRVLGEKVGTVLAGVLGGMISSTATTVSYARRSASRPSSSPRAAVVLALASTVVYARVLVEVSAVAPEHLAALAPPLAAAGAVMLAASGAGLLWTRGEPDAGAPEHAPSPLTTALTFAGIYAVVLVVTEVAREHVGRQGLYGVALLAGFTDVDAITLSVAGMLEKGSLQAGLAWRLILVGTLSNLVFKFACAVGLGSAELRRRLLPLFGAGFLGSVAVLLLWP